MIARTYIDLKDRATPELQRLMGAMQPEKIGREVGLRLRQLVRDHIKRQPKNKKGWPSTGFWEDAARGTDWELVPGGIVIKVNKIGFRQRYHGGVIRAVAAKFLTIPIASQAYGKTVADFPGSFLIQTRKGAYIVQYGGTVSKTGRGINKHNATLEFLFKLKRSVRQAEMPWIIPDATTMTATALDALGEHFRAVKTGGAHD